MPYARAPLNSWMRGLVSLVFAFGGFAGSAWAGLELSTDARSLFFGRMQLGEEKELAQFGTYHNEITCSSTGNKTWHLKINLLHPLAAGNDTIPVESFAWQLFETAGIGTVANQRQFVPFQLSPDLVYVSGPDEAKGARITFQLKYRLRIPEQQVKGLYQTTLRFTLTEVL